MRKSFKVNRICSSENYELSIRVYKKYYSDKWDMLFEEIKLCTPYYYFFGRKIILRNRREMNDVISKGFKIHFD